VTESKEPKEPDEPKEPGMLKRIYLFASTVGVLAMVAANPVITGI